MNLDFMPSPVPERPGLLIRDSFHYSDATLIIPPALVSALEFFDGKSTELDLREHLVRLTGSLEVGGLQQQMVEVLETSGFLENEVYERLRETRHREFAEAPERSPAHAGSAYPDDPASLRATMQTYLDGPAPENRETPLVGIAAPHVSPEGGWPSYRAAYRRLTPDLGERTFVILGTSHYGTPDRFGLTRKPYVTPWGAAETDRRRVDWLAERAGDAVLMEDYCHAIEHSIEFQVVFLQYLFGPNVRVLPILCGSFARSVYLGGMPENDEGVRRFLDALGEMAARDARDLVWVLGIDLAHIGRRYQDPFAAVAEQGPMLEVRARDQERLARVNAGDAEGFWHLVQQGQDDLKWCGSSPLYTFLRAAPGARGTLERYEQWNIDEQSVVTFAGIAFHSAA
jgi:AmmeMemoRadiSam system protein B